MSPEERKRRNVAIAAYGGGFLLPLAGLVAAGLLWANDDRELARGVLLAAVLGTIFWLLILTA